MVPFCNSSDCFHYFMTTKMEIKSYQHEELLFILISAPGVLQFTGPKKEIEFGQTYKTFSVLKPFLVAFGHLVIIKNDRDVY